jgi:hypothetical protein
MKNVYQSIRTSLLIALLFSVFSMNADVFHSTTGGGNWDNPATWDEAAVPTATDDVIITGPGAVIVYNNGYQCNDLTVNYGATLKNRDNADRSVTALGDVTNNGTITSSNYQFTLYVEGDFANAGSVSNYQINFNGSTTQYISCAAGFTFNCSSIYHSDLTHNLEAQTDLECYGTNFSMNGGTMVFPAGLDLTLTLHGGSLDDGTYEFNDGTLFMDGSAVIYSLTDIYDATLDGTVTIYENDVTMNGNIINSGTLINRTNAHRTLTIAGNFTNNGTVNSSNYDLSVYISGDIVNNGVWTPYGTYLNGTAKQYLTCGSGFEFAGEQFHDSDNTSVVEAVNDLVFGATSIFFNGSELILPAGGTSLTLHGSNIHNMVLTGNDNTLTTDANAALSSGDFHDLTLEGTCIIHENNSVYFYGEIINNGTLINMTNANITAYIMGNYTNNGTVQNSNYHFTIKCYGNLINNGTWTNWEVIMHGSVNQEMSCIGQNAFSMQYLTDQDNTSDITAAADLYFESTGINLGGGNLNLPSAQSYNLSIVGGYLYNGTLNANGHELFMHSEAYIQDMVVEDATLKGIARINNNGVVFNGNTIVEDTLQTRDNVNSTITVNDLITNNGLIRNSNYQLYVNVYGDIVNDGDWTNTTITMRGTSDQYVSCLGGHSFGVINFNDSDNSSRNISAGKVSFSGTNLDLSDGRLDCTGNELEFINNARLNNTEIEDAVLSGTILIDNNNVHFYGQTINNGTFQNPLNENISTYIYGDFTNNGTVTKPNYSLNIYFYGNVTNNGVWTFSDAHFANSTTQYITLAAGQEFACNNLINDDPSSPVEALTDLVFSGTQLNFNNGQLILPVTKGGTITLHGGYLYQIDLITNSGILEMDGGALLWDQTVVNNATLEGTVIIREDPVTFKGETINNGSLVNSINENIYWCNIDGNIINNGTIDDPNYQFYLRCNGNITNNGIWSNHYTQMMSLNTHELYQGGTGVFSGLNFVAADTTGTISLMTDFSFYNTKINLNGVTMELDNSKGANLSVVNEYLYNGTLKANGQNLYMNNTEFKEGYLQDIIVENATLLGVVCVDEGVVLNGNTIVEDTLQTRPDNNSTLTVNDTITNNGLIQNSNYQLYVNATGMVINNGDWTCNSLNMTGSANQHIKCINDKPISTLSFTNTDPLSLIVSDGNLLFYGTNVNLGGGELQMPSAKKLSVQGAWEYDGRFYNGIVSGEDFEYEGNFGAYIESLTFEPNVILSGEVHLDDYVVFNGYIINSGILQNRNNDNVTLNVGGRITNNGQIQNSNYEFYIYCQGDIVNNGTWTNTWTNLNGIEDQFVFLIDHQPISGQFQFDAQPLGTPYQWYYEDVILSSPDFNGETAQTLTWNVPVQQSWYGDYYCQTGGGDSRHITVGGGLLANIAVLLEGPFNTSEMSTALNIGGYLPLTHPYGGSPWNYIGTENVAAIPNGDIVDWVLVEYRVTPGGPEDASSATMVAKQAAFLLKDGTIVGMDGENELQIDISITDNLYIVVWHRNHLGVMTSTNVTRDGAAYTWDFRDDINKAYQVDQGYKDLGGGYFGMVSGDGDGNGIVQSTDETNVWKPQLNQAGYLNGDFNMSGITQGNDETIYWKPNLNVGGQVPAKSSSAAYRCQVPK